MLTCSKSRESRAESKGPARFSFKSKDFEQINDTNKKQKLLTRIILGIKPS